VQGAGVGGEWGGAVLMAVEHASPGKRGFYGSFPQMGVPGGLILANLAFLGVSAGMSDEAFAAWGWRIPFLASALLVLAGLLIRVTIAESPEFEEVKRSGAEARLPVVTVLKEHPKQVLLAADGFIGNNTVGYIFMAYLLSYGTTVLHLARTQMLVLILVGLAAWMLVLFPLVDTASPGLILVALLGTAVFLGATYGPLAALFCELFAALYAGAHSSAPVTAYLVAVSLLSLACLAVVTRPAGNSNTEV
jgi:MFS family permease